jgi:serine/threonine protein kinase/tetratricopeptide (TPR) repeat protein
MARVYEALDTRYGRKVAIKVLRPELTAEVGAERFLREIETSATLRHPHIVPLFDSGDSGGFLYYVMPLVEGESLRMRMDRERQLPLDEALAIACEVAGALGYAHERGVVHRDVKPENVLLENGHAVVVDFGIARAIGSAGVTAATQGLTRGVAVGTPRYMSPEQSAGETELDGRSDQYGLACMLYEMLCGRPPFEAASFARLAYQHLMEAPPPMSRSRPEVPAAVSVAVERALAKQARERFDTMAAFVKALMEPAEERAATRSVAVLPFLSLSTDPENDYFADGITEDVIAQLSRVRSLKVVSRASVMPFKRREMGLREIAARLNVVSLLDGSVRRAGSRVRIVAQLVDAATDRYLWAETYDRDLDDIFAIQSEVALRITDALEAELSSDERSRIERQPRPDSRAYQFHLRGRHHLVQFTIQSELKAVELFERAIEHDAEFAPPWAGLAMALTELGEIGGLKPDDAYPRARAAAARAVVLDPELADGHTIAGHVKLVYEFDWAGAEACFRRAIELSPGHADAWDLYGRLCAAQGRYEEAIANTLRSHELDPLTHRADLATVYLRAGRYEEALASITATLELDPGYARAHATQGWAHILLGRREEGIAALERAVDLAPGEKSWLAQLGAAYGMAGLKDRAMDILGQLLEPSGSKYVSPYHLAYAYTGLGRYDDAIDCLERAVDQRSGAAYGIKGSFLFTPLHEHDRFKALLARMHLG